MAQNKTVNNIGYPFIKTSQGLLNPIDSVLSNAKSKLLNLLNTNKGQRILSNNCQFGIDLNKLIFQNINYSDYNEKIQSEITKEINLWIPQIKVVKIGLTTNENTLTIDIQISINQQDFTNIVVEIENE